MHTSIEELIEKLEISMAMFKQLMAAQQATLQIQEGTDHEFRKQVSDIHKYIFTPSIAEEPKKRLTRKQRIEAEIQQRLDSENTGVIKPVAD